MSQIPPPPPPRSPEPPTVPYASPQYHQAYFYPPNPAYAPVKQSFPVQAARFSVWAPAVGIGLNIVARGGVRDRMGLLVIGFASFAIYLLGLVFGIIALARMTPFDRSQALGKAIAGVVMNGLLVAAFVAVLVVVAK